MNAALGEPAARVPRWPAVRTIWREHGLPLLLYALLSVLLTWPVTVSLTSQLPGESNDVHTMVWIMWHVKEAVLGNQPLFDLPLLYYPAGATLLTSIPGPLVGLMALPFWSWGPEAAYNGFMLVAFVLTAYPTYLLVRALGPGQPAAFFAGLYYLLTPMHLAGVLGHPTKMFLGLLPLALLCLHQLLDKSPSRQRAMLWAVASALVLLLMLLFTGLQFVMAGISIAFFAALWLWRGGRAGRCQLMERLGLLALFSLLLAGPLLWATARAALDPALDFNRNLDSGAFQPDVAEFVLPPVRSRLFGALSTGVLAQHGVHQGIETSVSLSWTAIVLAGLALLKAPRRVWHWLLFSALWFVLALGPSLKLLGRTTFTEYGLPIILPYAFLTRLPGLDFLRTPGRFMQMGYVGLAVASAIGLSWLLGRFPRRATLLFVAATSLILLENWPSPWPQMQLRPAPAFYQQLASDEEVYGVFDLPLTSRPEIEPILHSAYYQVFQMTHGKGIASGYISRVNKRHPVFPCFFDGEPVPPDMLVDGAPSGCSFHALYHLPLANYRYVVVHNPWPAELPYESSTWDENVTDAFLRRFFAGQEPLVDDEEVTVYELPRIADPALLATTLAPHDNWYQREGEGESGWRWAHSPATLSLSSPRAQEGVLEITPSAIYTPDGPQVVGRHGRLHVFLDGRSLGPFDMAAGETARVPLTMTPGIHTVTLALDAGNFRPSDYGQGDSRQLSFAVSSVNLRIGQVGP